MLRIKELIQSFVVFVYYIKSVMFDVDGCPSLLALTKVNALLASRSET